MTLKSGVIFLKNSPLCRGHVSENGVGNVSEKHALKWGHDPDKSQVGYRCQDLFSEFLGKQPRALGLTGRAKVSRRSIEAGESKQMLVLAGRAANPSEASMKSSTI